MTTIEPTAEPATRLPAASSDHSAAGVATRPPGTDGVRLGRIDPFEALPFPRHSMLRRVTSEPIVGVVLQRALLMEVAHPKVGSGVDDHSSFTTQPLRRGIATADAGLRLVFGSRDEALAVAEHIYRVHDHIHGSLAEPMPSAPPPDSYTAHDASLLLWVWATLVDTAFMAYQRWIRPMADDEADAFYADMCTWARFFGIAADLLPADRAEFAAYVDAMLDDPALGASAVSHRTAQQVLWPPARSVPDLGVRPMRVLSISLLDPRLRDRLGLSLSRRDERLATRFDAHLARWYHRIPTPLRTAGPGVYLAARRPVAAAMALVGKPLP